MSPKEDIVVLNSFEEIVFSSRNKEYGAYYIRKRYKKYLILAFFLSFFIIASAVVGPLLESIYNRNKLRKQMEKSVSVVLENVEDAPPPPPPPPPPAALEAQVKFVAPVVVDTVKEEVALATMDENLESSTAEAPPTEIVVEEKKEEVVEKEEPAFLVVEEPATFQGGDLSNFNAWVLTNIKYPQLAVENGISGKVYIQFAVNAKGKVVDTKVLRGVDPSLDQEAVRVVNSSPSWTPPKQGGRPVKQLFTLPVVFKLQE
jgi:periplasmic protein TonB